MTGSLTKRKPPGIIKGYYLPKSGRNPAMLDSLSFCHPLKAWLVQAMIVTDYVLKKNGNTLARWSYHCHLPKFTCSTQVTV